MNLKIAIVGSGNIAFHLSKRLNEVKNPVVGLVIRDKNNASDFGNFLAAEGKVSMNRNFSGQNWDVVVLAVSDGAIPEVLSAYEFPPKATLIHTSGSQPISVFENRAENHGVLYPLQTFSKSKEIDFSQVPVFVESNNEKSKSNLNELATLLSSKVSKLNSDRRLKLHLAAVLACNFTNLLYGLSEDQLKKGGLELNLLAPLIRETTEKALHLGPAQAQTGPASRGDFETISRHLRELEDQPKIKQVYEQLTKLITNQNE